MKLCQEIGNRWGVGTALRYLGLAALAQSDAAQARALLIQSLDVHRGFVAGWDIARTLIYLGQAAQALGDADAARAHYAEALAVAEASSLPLLAEEARAGLAQAEDLP